MTPPDILTQVKIPRGVIEVALNHARSNRTLEVGGMFALSAFDSVVYLPGVNQSAEPHNSIELSGEWIADQIVERGHRPLAFFHSHPSGTEEPSGVDMEAFPWMYVNMCLIYFGNEDKFCAYDADGYWLVKVHDGLWAELKDG